MAGGIKYWRGPHRVVLTDPTISKLQELTRTQLWLYAPLRSGEAMTYEYSYQNTWDGRELLTLQYNYTEPRPAIRQISLYGEDSFFHLSRSLPQYATDRSEINFGEAICWISGKLQQVSNEPFKPKSTPGYGDLNWLVNLKNRKLYGPAYLITSQKQIFHTKLNDLCAEYFEKIELDDIPDLEVRVQIQTIFAALPDN